jgi:hypothetical protein
MWFNKKQSEEKPDFPSIYNFPVIERYILFPKLETIIRQAEVHFESGDIELCDDILSLIWRTIDRSKEDMKNVVENRKQNPIDLAIKQSREIHREGSVTINTEK